ncbi:MAG: septum formation initiator family protein [Caldilineaceae bacterium]|jgi:cell division protein FtsB|nr:septum formation initiator family protein [Caldilineaceae bacterium]
MTTPPLPFGQPSERERRRNPRLLILLLVALCMVFVAGYFERLSRLDATREAVDEMRQQVAASQQRNANLQEELKRVQDPYYLALMARDGMGLVQEGDLPVVVYEGQPEPESIPATEQTTLPGLAVKPPWQQWVELIFPPGAPR